MSFTNAGLAASELAGASSVRPSGAALATAAAAMLPRAVQGPAGRGRRCPLLGRRDAGWLVCRTDRCSTTAWDDFTELMFFASECDYLVGLDPTFFYANDVEKYRTWVDIKRGKKRDFLDTVKDDFNASYILAHKGTSEFFYNRLNDYAQQGKLELCIRDPDDAWSLYRVVDSQ
jgi:hypothetical protein